jgi:hypothetical protein
MQVRFMPAARRLGWVIAAVLVVGVPGLGVPAHAQPAHVASHTFVASPASLPVNGSVIRITNQVTGRCLDADLNTVNQNGTRVQLWDCLPGTPGNQLWQVRNSLSGVALQSLYPPYRCLDADINGWTNGVRVQLWDCNGTAVQAWYMDSASGAPITNEYFFNSYPANGPYNLDADLNTIYQNGTTVQLWAPNGQPQQKWNWAAVT